MGAFPARPGQMDEPRCSRLPTDRMAVDHVLTGEEAMEYRNGTRPCWDRCSRPTHGGALLPTISSASAACSQRWHDHPPVVAWERLLWNFADLFRRPSF